MSLESEQRKFRRYDYTTPVEIRYENQSKIFNGIMNNYSSKGMCVQIESPISFDRDIYIRMKEYHPGKNGVNSYEWYSARVMWREKKDAKDASRYAIGVQFPRPLLY